MEYRDILVEVEGEIGRITLNSPTTMNALSRNMIAEMIGALDSFKGNSAVKVIIIKANGKHFCSGHFLKEMVDGSLFDYRQIFEQCTRMMSLVHDVPQIVIAQVHGVATAAGCQLVATCDMAVATETARFATPGVRIGLFCSTPMVALTRAVDRKLAMEMLVTGRMISAEEAVRHGLVNRIVPDGELETATAELARTVAEASPLTLALGKHGFYQQIELDEPRAYKYAVDLITLNLMSEDAQAGIKAFLKKEKPTWKGR